MLVRRKTWPKGKGFKSRAEVMQKLYDAKNPMNPQVKTLSLDKKLLHLFLTRNVVPRQEQKDQVTVGDAILMEQIITGSKVNLPAIMLAHMQHCHSQDVGGLPYPHLVVKFLSQLMLYPEKVMETSHSEFLILFTIRKELMELEDKPKDEVPPPAA